MSHWNKVGKFASNSCSFSNSMQKSGSGLGTFASMGNPIWEPIGKDRWSSYNKDQEYKPMSTVAYAKKLQGEEDLRKAFHQVPMSQIVKQVPKRTSSKPIYNEL